MRALQRRFREAPSPELAALVGRHEATFASWLRLGGPLAMSVTGMPGWWGKRFRVAAGGGDALEGENLLRRRGKLVESIPMTAQIAPSRVDGRPAILIKYPPDARWRRAAPSRRAHPARPQLRAAARAAGRCAFHPAPPGRGGVS